MGDIFIVKSHIINQSTVLLMGEYALSGKLCTRIMEGERSFLVDKTPLKVLNTTLNYIGFDLKGAIEGAKMILGKTSMVPIMLNPIQGICMFPTISPDKDDCIWFNPKHIVKTTAVGRRTIVELSNSCSIIVEMREPTFNNKVQIAEQLCRITTQRAQNEITSLYLEPKKSHKIIKEKTGKYNFDVLKKKKE